MNSQTWEEKINNLPGRIERKNHTYTHYYKNGEKIATINPNGKIVYFGQYAGSDMTEADLNTYAGTKETVLDETKFLQARAKAQEERNKFWNDFKNELLSYHGIENHPKAEKFFEILRNTNGDDISGMIGDAEEWADLLT